MGRGSANLEVLPKRGPNHFRGRRMLVSGSLRNGLPEFRLQANRQRVGRA